MANNNLSSLSYSKAIFPGQFRTLDVSSDVIYSFPSLLEKTIFERVTQLIRLFYVTQFRRALAFTGVSLFMSRSRVPEPVTTGPSLNSSSRTTTARILSSIKDDQKKNYRRPLIIWTIELRLYSSFVVRGLSQERITSCRKLGHTLIVGNGQGPGWVKNDSLRVSLPD